MSNITYNRIEKDVFESIRNLSFGQSIFIHEVEGLDKNDKFIFKRLLAGYYMKYWNYAHGYNGIEEFIDLDKAQSDLLSIIKSLDYDS